MPYALVLIFLSAAVLAQSQPRVSVRPYTEASQAVVLIVDGKVIPAESLQLVRGQQVMVWIRDLEALGWGKANSGAAGEVTFDGKGVTLAFTKGQGIAKVNSLTVQLPVDTYLKDGKLMVPLTFVAKALGYDCEIAYKAVASVTTSPSTVPSKAPIRTLNSLHGSVTYAGVGVSGVIVRAVDISFNVVKGAMTTTDIDGSFTIEGLPDGSYMAYVYVADNPSYFNRASEPATVTDGQIAELKPIALGRVLTPLKPKIGSKVSPSGGRIAFEWTPCEGAASYELTIKKPGKDGDTLRITSATPDARIPAAKLKAGDVYEASVIALDASGSHLGATAGAGANPWTFTVRGTPAKVKVRVRQN